MYYNTIQAESGFWRQFPSSRHVKVQVVDVKGRQVRLGITAPAACAVHREEVFQRIQEQNRQSIDPAPSDLDALAAMWGKLL